MNLVDNAGAGGPLEVFRVSFLPIPIELGVELIPRLAALPEPDEGLGPPILLDPRVILPIPIPVPVAGVIASIGNGPPNGVSNNI